MLISNVKQPLHYLSPPLLPPPPPPPLPPHPPSPPHHLRRRIIDSSALYKSPKRIIKSPKSVRHY